MLSSLFFFLIFFSNCSHVSCRFSNHLHTAFCGRPCRLKCCTCRNRGEGRPPSHHHIWFLSSSRSLCPCLHTRPEWEVEKVIKVLFHATFVVWFVSIPLTILFVVRPVARVLVSIHRVYRAMVSSRFLRLSIVCFPWRLAGLHRLHDRHAAETNAQAQRTFSQCCC